MLYIATHSVDWVPGHPPETSSTQASRAGHRGSQPLLACGHSIPGQNPRSIARATASGPSVPLVTEPAPSLSMVSIIVSQRWPGLPLVIYQNGRGTP